MSIWSWLFSAALGVVVLLASASPQWAQGLGEDAERPKNDVDMFLEEFQAAPRQDPFSPLVKLKPLPKPRVEASFIEITTDAPTTPKEVVFDGHAPMEGSGYERMPRIKVTGVLQVRGRMAVSGLVEEEAIVLHPGDTFVLDNTPGSEDRAKHFTVVAINADGMTIVLDDGQTIRGKFL